ncbi:MAG: host attachment protein [Patescibacteria group bacterium]|jgi:protein required for attachment to host cells
MQLPQDLQAHFPHPTLLITADHMTAKLYLAGGDSIEELDGITEPRDIPTDTHDSTSSGDGIRTSNPNADNNDEPRIKHLIKRIAERMEKLVKEHNVGNIHLVMPADMLHPVKDHLSQDTIKLVRSETPGMLMKEDILDVIRRIFA